jgi:hypothetical protein
MAHPGRPSKLPKVETFLDYIKKGLSIEAAAGQSAIDPMTVYRWKPGQERPILSVLS